MGQTPVFSRSIHKHSREDISHDELNSNWFAAKTFQVKYGKGIKRALLSVYPMTVDVITLVKSKYWLGPIGNRTGKPAPSARKYIWCISLYQILFPNKRPLSLVRGLTITNGFKLPSQVRNQ